MRLGSPHDCQNPDLMADRAQTTHSNLFLTSAVEEMVNQEHVCKSLTPSQTLQVSSRKVGASLT